MKRLSFTPAMRDAVLSGRKSATTRRAPKPFPLGELVAAVCGEGRPGFLVPVRDAFARLRIYAGAHWTLLEAAEHYRQEGFDSRREFIDYYRALNPGCGENPDVWTYWFEVVGQEE